MDNVSRPLIALLVATVAVFGLYFVAFKGGSSATSDGTSKQSLGAYSSDIAAAHNAVTTSNRASAAQGNVPSGSSSSSSSTPAKTSSAAASSAKGSKSATSSKSTTSSKSAAKTVTKSAATSSSTKNPMTVVDRALAEKKVLAMLFYNPAASDDREVKQELASVPTHKGRVVKVAVPISQLANYEGVTTQIPINETPTLVLISGNDQATTIVGFADSLEISQRVADAVAVK